MKRIGLRLADDLHAALVALAAQQHRSLHSLMIHALWAYVEAHRGE